MLADAPEGAQPAAPAEPYESHEQLRMHLADFMAAYNFARRLKTLSGLTPYEYIDQPRTIAVNRRLRWRGPSDEILNAADFHPAA